MELENEIAHECFEVRNLAKCSIKHYVEKSLKKSHITKSQAERATFIFEFLARKFKLDIFDDFQPQ